MYKRDCLMDRLLQFAVTEPDKIFKHRRQKVFGVSYFEISFNSFGANGWFKEELDGRESPTVAQPIGGSLQIICCDLGVDNEPGRTH